MPDQKRIRVIVADDEELARERLCQILREEDEIEIVAECANGFEVVKLVTDLKPDLLLLDIQMPRLDGFEDFSLSKFLGSRLPRLPPLRIIRLFVSTIASGAFYGCRSVLTGAPDH